MRSHFTRRRRCRAALAGAVLTLAPVVALAYSSPEDKLGYSACTWAPEEVVRVGIDPAFPFPAPEYGARLDEAIGRWNTVLSGTATRVGLARSDTAPQVVVQYRQTATTDAADVLGETYLQREGDPDLSADIGRCPDRSPALYRMRAAEIRINPRNDWYTGDDASVGSWQMCGDSQSFRTMNPILCEDQVDFASTMVHELAHALVLYHPQTLDDIDGIPVGDPGSASSYARCVEASGSFADQATLCAGQGVWRAEQRTLEVWDTDTVSRHSN